MAATSTLGAILQQLAEETGLGYVIPSYTGTTTTLTLTNAYAAGPFSGAKFPIGAPVVVTSTTGLGDNTYVAGYVPSTGVVTVSPAITTASTDCVVFDPTMGIDHPDRVIEAVNRAINNRLARWQLCPLTYVSDGDLQGATVTDWWTGTNATPAYVTPLFPGTISGGGRVNVHRVLQSTTTNATNSVKSDLINVPLNASTTAYQWYFQTAIRVVSGTGNAQIYAYDETNSAAITANVIAGDNQTHTTNSIGFITMSGTLNIPATCKQITFRLVSSATATVIQMMPLVAYPVDALSFPLPNRLISDNYVGNFHYGTPTTGTSGPFAVLYSDPITVGGRTHTINDFGDHRTVTFNFRPIQPVYYDELMSDPQLTLLSSTTSFPIDHVVKWAKYELYKQLYNRERRGRADSGVPLPSLWRQRLIEAKREAERCDYEPRTITVYGRV